MAKAQPLFAVEPGGLLAANAPLILYTRFSEMLAFAVHIDDQKNVTELHGMRIAAKRLRYTLEIFAPAYEAVREEFDGLTERAKTIQEMIGEIHDCDIRLERIGEYLNQHIAKKPEIRVGLQTLIDRERLKREDLYGTFIEHWRNVSADHSFEQHFVTIVFHTRVPVIAREVNRDSALPTAPQESQSAS